MFVEVFAKGLMKVFVTMFVNMLLTVFTKVCLHVFVEYGHEAKPSILGLQIVFLAASRDDHGDGGDYRARQEL